VKTRPRRATWDGERILAVGAGGILRAKRQGTVVATTFDTHKFIRRVKDSGLPEAQA
jgi:hypothetical protein